MLKKINVTYTGHTKEAAVSNAKRLEQEGRPSWRVCYKCKRSGRLEHEYDGPPSDEILYPVRDVIEDGKKTLEYELCRKCLQELWKSFREGWR